VTRQLRIGLVGPVATTIPAAKNGSVELVTSLLCEELVARGHEVSLFGAAKTKTGAKLIATFEHGYLEDPHGMWPWEMCELLNVAAACERHRDFDVIHYQGAYFPMTIAFSRMVDVPVVQTIHHQPVPSQLSLFRKYPDTHFVAISSYQAAVMTGLHSVTTIMHGLDIANFPFCTARTARTERTEPEDYLVFLGRFTPGKGVLAAIEIARRAGVRLKLAAPESEYYREQVAPHVDGKQIQYVGELDFAEKTALLQGAQALLYPVQEGEPFGLVLVEAMACGTPVVALRRGAVSEIVRDGVSGYAFDSIDELVVGLPQAYTLDRRKVREHAMECFDTRRMVDGYERLYRRVAASR